MVKYGVHTIRVSNHIWCTGSIRLWRDVCKTGLITCVQIIPFKVKVDIDSVDKSSAKEKVDGLPKLIMNPSILQSSANKISRELWTIQRKMSLKTFDM